MFSFDSEKILRKNNKPRGLCCLKKIDEPFYVGERRRSFSTFVPLLFMQNYVADYK